MARKKDTQAVPVAKVSTLLTLVLWVLVFLVGVNTYLLWDTRNMTTMAAGGVQVKAPEPVDPVFVTISPFTVNLQSDQFGPRLLYAGLTLEVPSEKVKATLVKNMPQVRNRLLVLLSGQNAERITQSEGKRMLAQSIMETLTEPYSGNAEVAINDVLFTEFIVQ